MAKKPAKRVRDAGTGKIVAPSEAEKRPNETVVESGKKDGISARVALIEQAIEQAGGPLAVRYRRLKAGFTD